MIIDQVEFEFDSISRFTMVYPKKMTNFEGHLNFDVADLSNSSSNCGSSRFGFTTRGFLDVQDLNGGEDLYKSMGTGIYIGLSSV